MKTSELTGQQLDYLVAKAQGWVDDGYVWIKKDGDTISKALHTPSIIGGQCFELLTKVDFTLNGQNYAHVIGSSDSSYGPTLNIAICRAFVASVYGEEVIYEQN